ncbi:MAG: alkyl hydroperoxide reductase subunit F, partial [Leptospiraceae bacterium]|nr:alkyl hydroperoxide reductase subunit F [Leptospiraceae bacterium]
MLDEAIKNQLRDYFKKIHNPVFMEYEPGEHAHKAELLQMLNAVAELNEKIIVRERKGGDALRGPLSFTLATEERHTGVVFSGIPGGHEFSSLVLAILQTGGAEIKLDDGIQNFVRRIGTRLRFETVVSL